MRKILFFLTIILFSCEIYAGGHREDPYGPRPKIKFHGLTNAQCPELGLCFFDYESKEVREKAKELGFASRHLKVRILNFEPNALRKLNPRCRTDGDWLRMLWQSTVNHVEEAERVTVVGRKYKKGMFGHVYFGQRDSITSIVKLLNRKTKQDCKF